MIFQRLYQEHLPDDIAIAQRNIKISHILNIDLESPNAYIIFFLHLFRVYNKKFAFYN